MIINLLAKEDFYKEDFYKEDFYKYFYVNL